MPTVKTQNNIYRLKNDPDIGIISQGFKNTYD